MIDFVFSNIFTRFGIPKAIITDNGAQFEGSKFKKFCADYGVKFFYSSPAYPQSNGLAERSNKTILDGIKKRLDEAKGAWVDELPSVLWTYRTTPRKSTGETPFSLTYGSEAIIPPEIGLPTVRTQYFSEEENNRVLALDLNLAEEKREGVLKRLAIYQHKLRQYHDAKVRGRGFLIGDKVLRKVLPNTKIRSDGKLGPVWEGPYMVSDVCSGGAYRLKRMDGSSVPRPWNAFHLKKFWE